MIIVFSHYSEGSWVTFQMFNVILFPIIFVEIFQLIRLVHIYVDVVF